jgi:hypothetical protein
MTGLVATTELGALFEQAARTCRDAFAAHLETGAPDRRFQQQTLFAVAVLDGCAAHAEIEVADVQLVARAASDAAAVCRTEPPDPALAGAVSCLEAVVAACLHAVGEPPDPADEGWRRFLFADADLAVQRGPRRWRIRVAGQVTEQTMLDVALEDALGLRPARTAALAVSILDWFERGETTRPADELPFDAPR